MAEFREPHTLRMRTFHLARAVMLAAMLAGSPFAAAVEVLPPLLAISDPNNGIVAGAILAIDVDPPSIQFRVDERLRGDAEGNIRLLVSPDDLPLLSIGDAYLAVYTDLARDSMKPRKLVRVPERARLMTFEGVELSLFRDSATMRKLLTDDPLKAAGDAGYRQRIFSGLGEEDPQQADLWSGELALRAQRLSPWSTAELASIESFVRSAQSPERARARLLLLAFDRRPLLGEDWFVAAAADLLAATPVRPRPDASTQSLVHAALLIATAHPQRVDGKLLTPWLASTPVLAESAALALRAQSPDNERAALDRVLRRALLPRVTRQFLEQHRQRLQAASASATSVSVERRGS
jgi:hypothetical protein